MAATEPLPTRFAPAERATEGELVRLSRIAQGLTILEEVLSTLPALVLVLNAQRQVVFANRAAVELVNRTEDDIRGMRPGELLGCVHAHETPGGCGTTESCAVCGLVRAILDAQDSDHGLREARLSLESGDPMDLRVTTHRIAVGGENLTVLALEDIADEKRRRVLERVFFHDVLNTAGGVRGLADLLGSVSEEQRQSIVEMLQDAADQLLSEIQAQRLLAAAESRDYEVTSSEEPLRRVVSEAVATQTALARFRTVRIEVDPKVPNTMVKTDHTMLGRVLGNLIKNAVEASREGMTVRVGADSSDDRAHFWVFNPTSLPREVELQMFQRSFSTKGPDRGLGTYSVKLFTERYLGGKVSFVSTAAGTTFVVDLPLPQG